MTGRVGFSGSRYGFGDRVIEVASALREAFEAGAEFHHGCCIGSDVEAAAIAKDIGYRIIAHPPIKDDSLAPREQWLADEVREPLSYFARNRAIVAETEILVATPPTSSPSVGGGTWYTVDHARRRMKRPVVLILPAEA